MSEQTVQVDVLSRVEGEGSLYIKVRQGKIEDLRFKIFEPPRFFEAFLRGKNFSEVPDITSRICGICPFAYQMSSIHALESIFGTQIQPEIRELRRLFYCGEWIESHALHIYFLHAPDFLGYPDVLAMAKRHKDLVEMALRLKKIGNDLMVFLGGREIHPISARVGGFYKTPTVGDIRSLKTELEWARKAAEKTLKWTAGLTFPDFEQDYEFVCLRHPQEYPLNEGKLISNRGLDIPVSEFNKHIKEIHVPHSNALHSVIRNRGPYHVGPLARFNLNFDLLPDSVQKACKKIGLVPPVLNPFKSIVVRAAETLYACEEALRIIHSYKEPERPFTEPDVCAGEGHGCTEAPRGILYHRYKTDSEGAILEAQIAPPTAQNQACIETDLRNFALKSLHLPQKEFSLRCEQAVRNYDPCISCATHFLKVTVDRDEA